MEETVRILQRLGFGDNEARAYLTLLRHSLSSGPMSGYELAKLSGIPRANVYDLLPRLEERGAVVRLDSASGARYSAVPPSELMPRLAGRFNDDLLSAEEALAGADPTSSLDQDYAWNIESRRSVIDHARTLIEGARSEVLLAVLPEEAGALAGTVARAQARGLSITTLCLAACSPECGGCKGSIHKYRLSQPADSRWLVVSVDGKEMLAGHIKADGTAYAVRTTQLLLVELASSYVRNSVALATLISELGDRFGNLLSPRAMSVLGSLDPDRPGGGWLGYMRDALQRSSSSPASTIITPRSSLTKSARPENEGKEQPTE